MSKIKHKIAIISGKGGVGKSLVASLVAVTLRRSGYEIGILDADITALKIWGENEKALVNFWANEPNLLTHVQELLTISRDSSQPETRLLSSRPLAELQKELAAVAVDKDYQGFAVIDRSGLILASNKENPYVGKHIAPAFMSLLARVFQDVTLIEKPTLKNRLDTYEKNAKPIIKYYKKRGKLKKVDAIDTLSYTKDDIKKIVGI